MARMDATVATRMAEELTCPVCLEPAQLPVNFLCFRGCGGRFSAGSTCLRGVLCLHCANDALQLGRPPQQRFPDASPSPGAVHCFICRETRVDARVLTPESAYLLNHNVMGIMDVLGLGGTCRSCEEECGSQAALHTHYLRRCPAAVVRCRFRGCSAWHTRRAAAAHEDTCAIGRAACGQCGAWVDRSDMLRHMVSTCRLRVVNCMLCKHSAPLPDMLEHLRGHQTQLAAAAGSAGSGAGTAEARMGPQDGKQAAVGAVGGRDVAAVRAAAAGQGEVAVAAAEMGGAAAAATFAALHQQQLALEVQREQQWDGEVVGGRIAGGGSGSRSGSRSGSGASSGSDSGRRSRVAAAALVTAPRQPTQQQQQQQVRQQQVSLQQQLQQSQAQQLQAQQLQAQQPSTQHVQRQAQQLLEQLLRRQQRVLQERAQQQRQQRQQQQQQQGQHPLQPDWHRQGAGQLAQPTQQHAQLAPLPNYPTSGPQLPQPQPRPSGGMPGSMAAALALQLTRATAHASAPPAPSGASSLAPSLLSSAASGLPPEAPSPAPARASVMGLTMVTSQPQHQTSSGDGNGAMDSGGGPGAGAASRLPSMDTLPVLLHRTTGRDPAGAAGGGGDGENHVAAAPDGHLPTSIRRGGGGGGGRSGGGEGESSESVRRQGGFWTPEFDGSVLVSSQQEGGSQLGPLCIAPGSAESASRGNGGGDGGGIGVDVDGEDPVAMAAAVRQGPSVRGDDGLEVAADGMAGVDAALLAATAAVVEAEAEARAESDELARLVRTAEAIVRASATSADERRRRSSQWQLGLAAGTPSRAPSGQRETWVAYDAPLTAAADRLFSWEHHQQQQRQQDPQQDPQQQHQQGQVPRLDPGLRRAVLMAAGEPPLLPPPPPIRRSFSDSELVFDVLEEMVREASVTGDRPSVRSSMSGVP